jgi:hypothetical protein
MLPIIELSHVGIDAIFLEVTKNEMTLAGVRTAPLLIRAVDFEAVDDLPDQSGSWDDIGRTKERAAVRAWS